MTPRIGELFAGYGGLGEGVKSVLGGEYAWFVEYDAAPSKILAHWWPNVPNYGDITKVDWSQVEPVDILTGGSPCQDLSHAGRRKGMTEGTRSNLWVAMREAIAQLRPSLVVWENVRGAYSACADSEVGRCPRCVGDDPTGAHAPSLRALGRVLGDLSDLGFDAQWYGVRAADAGAPHGRFRVFVFAWPAADADDDRRAVLRPGGPRTSLARSADTARPVAEDADVAVGGQRRFAAPGQAEGGRTRPDAGRRGRAPAADASGQRHGRVVHPGDVGRVDGEDAGRARQRERSREVPGDRGATAPAGTDVDGLEGVRRLEPVGRDAHGRSGADVAWGDYEPAIRRWERLTRPAPAPTEPGKNGQPRLSQVFVEWLMGLPLGHVTDPAIGLTRNEQLKALGNGVVPQQAALATRMWLATRTSEVAA